MCSPRPVAPSSSTPATSVAKRMQRVQWMQRFIEVLTSGPELLVGHRALVLVIAAAVEAVAHRLVLQVALAALVADRAVERMVDQQELHHALARLLHHRRGGEDLHACRRPAARSSPAAWADLASPRPGTCGSCRRSTGARGSRSAGSRRPPARRPAGSVMPAGTSISTPSIVSLGIACSLPYSAASFSVRARMRRSISGRKWRIRPWIGQAAASPSAQIVWPSTCLVTSSSSVDLVDARVARHHALHHAPHPAGALAARRALAAALVLVELATAARSPSRCRSTCP